MSNFIEKELLVGAGVTGATGIFVTEIRQLLRLQAAQLVADDLFHNNWLFLKLSKAQCAWIMSKPMFLSLRKLKDQNGTYLLNPDIRTGFGWAILGQEVFISENAPNNAIAFGDFSGLYVKLAQNVEIQVLQEMYATRHATGVVGYTEFDSRIVEDQKISIMELAGA